MRKPFDIKAAKAGAKVVTRDGRPVRILCYDNTEPDYPIVAVVYEHEYNSVREYADYTANGVYCIGIEGNGCDLFIEEEQTYRPYANAEEMDEAVKKHGVILKNSLGRRLTITGFDDGGVSVGVGRADTYETLLKSYTWIDGTPCGIEEEGDND